MPPALRRGVSGRPARFLAAMRPTDRLRLHQRSDAGADRVPAFRRHSMAQDLYRPVSLSQPDRHRRPERILDICQTAPWLWLDFRGGVADAIAVHVYVGG